MKVSNILAVMPRIRTGDTLKTLIFLACICLVLCCRAAWAKEKAPEEPKPVLVTSVEQIVRGATFQDQNVKNISFTIKPTSAKLSISF